VKSLFDRGLTAEAIRQLFRVIDWLLELPRELEQQGDVLQAVQRAIRTARTLAEVRELLQ